MTREAFFHLVAEMRAMQKFASLWPKEWKYKALDAEDKVDAAIKEFQRKG